MGVWVNNPNYPDVSGKTSLTLVRERFDLTQGFATDSFQATKDFMANVEETVKALEVPSTSGIDDVALPEILPLDYASRPQVGNLTIPDDWPTDKPIAPLLDQLPTLIEFSIPIMAFSPPSWNNPQKPVIDIVSPPGEQPVLNTPDIISAPTLEFPTAPTLETISMPSPPSSTIPEFNEELLPEGFAFDDGLSFNWQESPYNSEVWDTLLDKVVDGIRNGGTGLGADVEAELWDRAQRRQEAENAKLYNEIEEYYASRGWQIPPGAMAGRLAEAAQEIAKNNTDLNGKIAIEQAELAQKNTQFLIEKGINLETILREFFTASANRAFDAAKMVVSSAIDIYNAKVAGYNLKIERYKAQAVVFEARVRAALEAVEIYKAQVEGARLSIDIQKNLIEIYEKQLLAIETRVRLYTAQMEGVKIATEVENLKLESYRLSTQAYATRLEGEKIKFDIYSKEVDAEVGKAQVYAEQVRAYLAEVDAAKARNELQLNQLNAVATKNTLLIDQYKGELTGYTSEIDAVSKKVDGVVRGFEAEVRAYAAETEAEAALYGAKTKEIEARVEQSRLLITKAVAEIEAATKGYVAIKELQIEGVKGAMNVGAQLSSAAMNAVNATANIGYTQSVSESADYNHSQSISEQHSYQHE
jgi:hypothetical protein